MLVYFLIAQGRLDAPLLYLSDYLEADRRRYYASLAAIQQRGDPVPWVELFLAAVRTQAGDALTRATTILVLRDRYLEGGRHGHREGHRRGRPHLSEPGLDRPANGAAAGSEPSNRTAPVAAAGKAGRAAGAGPRDAGQRHYVAEEMMRAVAGEVSRR